MGGPDRQGNAAPTAQRRRQVRPLCSGADDQSAGGGCSRSGRPDAERAPARARREARRPHRGDLDGRQDGEQHPRHGRRGPPISAAFRSKPRPSHCRAAARRAWNCRTASSWKRTAAESSLRAQERVATLSSRSMPRRRIRRWRRTIAPPRKEWERSAEAAVSLLVPAAVTAALHASNSEPSAGRFAVSGE